MRPCATRKRCQTNEACLMHVYGDYNDVHLQNEVSNASLVYVLKCFLFENASFQSCCANLYQSDMKLRHQVHENPGRTLNRWGREFPKPKVYSEEQAFEIVSKMDILDIL